MNYEDMLIEFMAAMDLAIGDTPSKPEEKTRLLWWSLIWEELMELLNEYDGDNIVEVSDAMADLVYVIIGAAVAWGIPFDEIFKEVHRSNMTKMGDDGKAVHSNIGKVVKGPNYEPPRIKEILEKYA
jgi:hypothetical protein